MTLSGNEERQQALGVEHERRAHVEHGRGRDVAVEAEPDEAFNELVDREERGERGEEELAAVLDLGQRDDADGGQNAAAYEVCGCREAHSRETLGVLEIEVLKIIP